MAELGQRAAMAMADKFEPERETVSAILFDVWQRSMASSTAETQATAGQFKAAFAALGFRELDQYLHCLGEWREGFEHIVAGGVDRDILYLCFLLHAIRIMGWVRPNRGAMYEQLVPA